MAFVGTADGATEIDGCTKGSDVGFLLSHGVGARVGPLVDGEDEGIAKGVKLGWSLGWREGLSVGVSRHGSVSSSRHALTNVTSANTT